MGNGKNSIRVLLFAPEPSLGGGVAAFDALLRKKFSPQIEAIQFRAGRRPGTIGKLLRIVMPIYDSIRLCILLLRRRIDVFHLNPSLVPRAVIRDGLFLLVLRTFRRSPVIVFFRGWDPAFYERIESSRLARSLFSLAYGHADRLLVLASEFANGLIELGFRRDRIHLMTTMFDADLFKGVQRSRSDQKIVVLFLGRLVAGKGIQELLEGFRNAHRSQPTIELIIAGEGPESQAARDWCSDNGLQHAVSFAGHVEGTSKAQLLMDADMFVLPSYREGCPNALLEALAAGLPVIVTNVGGMPDIVENGVNGLVVDARNSDAISHAIATLASDTSLRNRIRHNNLNHCSTKYESRIVTKRLESHYDAVIYQPIATRRAQ